jgi:AcrR family transcriptional regulator
MIKKTRGRPIDNSKINSIIETARTLFAQNGFARTTLDAIAEMSGVTKMTIYSHFKSKEELFGATITNRIKKEFAFDLKADLLNSFSFFMSNRINSIRDFYISQSLLSGTFRLLIFLSCRLKKMYPIIISCLVFFIPTTFCNISYTLFFKFLFRKTQLRQDEIRFFLRAIND